MNKKITLKDYLNYVPYFTTPITVVTQYGPLD